MENKKRNPFLRFLKEIAIVVIGVLIAASLNKFKEDIGNRRYINKTLDVIQKEIDYSQSDLNEVLDKHIVVIDSLNSKLDSGESISEILIEIGGIQKAEIKNIGLRFFISNKAELTDYELISKLSGIEGTSQILEEKMTRMMNFLFEHIEKRDRENKKKFLLHLSNVIDSEMKLLKLYSEFSYKKPSK
ncbi:MAG: DUF948 domain-containing protein [Bacteroidota bacterium]